MAIFVGDKATKSIMQTGQMMVDMRDKYMDEVDSRTATAAQYRASEADFATIHPKMKVDLNRRLKGIMEAQQNVISTGGAAAERELQMLKDQYDKALNIYAARTKEIADIERERSSGSIINSEEDVTSSIDSMLQGIDMEGYDVFNSPLADATKTIITPIPPSPVTSQTFEVAFDKQRSYVASRLPLTNTTTLDEIDSGTEGLLTEWWDQIGSKDVDTRNAAIWTYISKMPQSDQTQAKFNEVMTDEAQLNKALDEYWENQLPTAKKDISDVLNKELTEYKSRLDLQEGRTKSKYFEIRSAPFKIEGVGAGGDDVILQNAYIMVDKKHYVDLSGAAPVFYQEENGVIQIVNKNQFMGGLSDNMKRKLDLTLSNITSAPATPSGGGSMSGIPT